MALRCDLVSIFRLCLALCTVNLRSYLRFVISKIPKIVNFTREERVKRDIFCQKTRLGDVLYIYFEQIQSFFALTPVF